MIRKRSLRKLMWIVPAVFIIFLIGFGSFYTYWNTASPEKTCASCHEIGRSVKAFAQSSHRDFHCSECHGTALSNGMYSLSEKTRMVVSHIKNAEADKIMLSEPQLLRVMDNCRRCHASTFAKWSSGGHSIDYGHVFLNPRHNSTEQINFDCLRCHGMFFKGSVTDIIAPLNIRGPWKLLNEELAKNPAIPCMACHLIHQKGTPVLNPGYDDPKAIFYQRKNEGVKSGFYVRHEKTWYPANELPKLKLWQGAQLIAVSDDPVMRGCIQCHAPNAHHQAGTSDDRTPRGVHEGLSCRACHDVHSNDARNSCTACHPAISNCKLDVTTMNTTFADSQSPNNIHFVSCTDCHAGKAIRKLQSVSLHKAVDNKSDVSESTLRL